jgi:hypothetical protein
MDFTSILWTFTGAGALGLAFLDYRLSLKKRVKAGKLSEQGD